MSNAHHSAVPPKLRCSNVDLISLLKSLTAVQRSSETRETSSSTRSASWSWGPGVLLTASLAALAFLLSQIWFIGQVLHLGPVVLAIVLGAALRHTVSLPAHLQPGIRFSLKKVLYAAIILLGFELNIREVLGIGGVGLAVVCLVVGGTLCAAYAIGRGLGLRRKLCLLIAAGCAICGTSAIVAADAAIDADAEDTTYAIATVSALGTFVLFIYPLVQAFAGLPTAVYGAWTGASVHSVGHAVAAGFAVSPEAGKVASLLKLTRVVFIAPVTLGLALLYAYQSRSDHKSEQGNGVLSGVTVPWFVVGFLSVIVVNSTEVLSPRLTKSLVQLDSFLLAMAMAAMGLEMRFGDMQRMGLNPFWTGVLATVFSSATALILSLYAF